MELDAQAAREIVDAAYAAWNRGDVEALLAQYVDDLTFWSNTAGEDGGPITIVGKPAFRTFVQQLADTVQGISVTESFTFIDGVGRAKVDYYIRHTEAQLILSGSFRQLTTFRGDKILRVEQFHDAARTNAYWRMVGGVKASS